AVRLVASCFRVGRGTATASAATLRGVVVDGAGGERLSRVRLRIDGSDRTVETNEAGEFAFEDLAEGEHVISGEAVGYRLERQKVTVTGTSSVDLYMALTPDALRVAESVTVTADAFSDTVPSAALQTSLHGREVKALSSVLVGDPIRAMANLPGVALTNDYEARFAVRGAPFARVGFYLDDVYLPSPMHGFGGALDGYSISALNNQVIER